MATKLVTVAGIVYGPPPANAQEPVVHHVEVGEAETGAGYLEAVYNNEDPPRQFVASSEIPSHVTPTPK